ncbi:MAG: tetratricopeptide repeat protein [Symploca sp. SIO2D2]|nr:tetratricopeptide repeat protein [Symploca sp. SIO2D2]
MPRAVILTALPVEYQAVRNRLIDLEEKLHPLGIVYEQGKFIAKGQEWKVGIAEVGTGNAEAAAEVERAIAYFQPNIILFVGIAGGIKDVAIGDVVVATEVYKHESGKVTEKFLTRPKAGKSAYSLVQRAKFEAKQQKWLQQPRVFVGPIVAGEKVIASRQSAIFQLLRESYNDAIAVEMEGFGFLNAAFAHPKIPAIVIRGISDLIEGKNDDSVEPEGIRQEKASKHASAFAFEMLAKLKITSQETSEQGTGSRELRRSSLQSIFSRVTQLLGWLPTVVKQNQIDGSGNRVLPVKQYSKKTRKLALIGLFAVALLMVVSGRSWYHQQSLLKNQVVVLVANFENPQDDKWGVTKDIIHQLEEALAEYDDVEVKALNEEITAQEGIKVARAKGEKHHADIMLWGWYQDTSSHAKVTVKFEVLEKLRSLSSVQTKPLTQTIAKLESFEIQTQLSKEMSYLTLFTIGLVRYEAEDYDGAIARFTKALEFVTDAKLAIVQDADTAINALYFYRGVAYYEKGELDKAIVDYNRALKINPEYATYINRGNAYYYKGELDQAIADFTQALKINPEGAKAYNNRGKVYSDKGELNQAITNYTQAIKIDPKFALAYNNRGNAYSDKGELNQAIADYTQALKFNPEYAAAYNNRGNAYYYKGELDQAIADYNLAIKINPEYAAAYNNRGNAYYYKGELDQVIADYNRALKINPEDADAYYNRGIAYSKLGEKQKAIQDFQKAAKLFAEQGDTAKQKEVLELLKQLQQD